MGKSVTGETVGLHLRHEIIREIVARAEALSTKKGTYAVKIVEWWYAQGCPAVTPADQAMQDLKALKAAEAKQAGYGAKKKAG